MDENKYENLIRSIEIVNIELQELNCGKNNAFSKADAFNLDIGLNNEIIEQFYDEEKYVVYIKFNVSAFKETQNEMQIAENDESNNQKNTLFNVDFVLESTYKLEANLLNNEVDDYSEELKTFGQRNVLINTWPYAREIISTMTTRLGFPPLIIPTYKKITKY